MLEKSSETAQTAQTVFLNPDETWLHFFTRLAVAPEPMFRTLRPWRKPN